GDGEAPGLPRCDRGGPRLGDARSLLAGRSSRTQLDLGLVPDRSRRHHPLGPWRRRVSSLHRSGARALRSPVSWAGAGAVRGAGRAATIREPPLKPPAWALAAPALLLAGCAAPFADLQGARLAGPGRTEVTGSYSWVSYSESGQSEAVQREI